MKHHFRTSPKLFSLYNFSRISTFPGVKLRVPFRECFRVLARNTQNLTSIIVENINFFFFSQLWEWDCIQTAWIKFYENKQRQGSSTLSTIYKYLQISIQADSATRFLFSTFLIGDMLRISSKIILMDEQSKISIESTMSLTLGISWKKKTCAIYKSTMSPIQGPQNCSCLCKPFFYFLKSSGRLLNLSTFLWGFASVE